MLKLNLWKQLDTVWSKKENTKVRLLSTYFAKAELVHVMFSYITIPSCSPQVNKDWLELI